jgi:phosphoribosylamine--glycine ligase
VRFLGIGDDNELGALYLALQTEGHECRVAIADPASQDILDGMVSRTHDWQEELAWIREAGNDGVILFETATDGATQDALRADGFQVIGGSALGDRLENDRAFGQSALVSAGMQVAPTYAFTDLRAAIDFVTRKPGRYVFKLSGGGYASTRNFVARLEDGSDMIAFLEHRLRRQGEEPDAVFILMEHLTGVEVGVGAYFDGEDFLQPTCLDWEHKPFFPGNLGELTGEMGTLVTYRGGEQLFAATLLRLRSLLAGDGYVGYINLNTIVNDRGVWPLELTCRFGYPGFAILSALHRSGWSDLFRRMIRHERGTPFPTRDGYAVGVVLTVPPFPYRENYEGLSKGLPVLLSRHFGDEDRRHIHFGEVARKDGALVTAGVIGYVGVVTGCGATAEAAREDAYRRVGGITIPNLRYRNDIGARFIAEERAKLEALGWLPTPSSQR